jgi:hypothetical protein
VAAVAEERNHNRQVEGVSVVAFVLPFPWAVVAGLETEPGAPFVEEEALFREELKHKVEQQWRQEEGYQYC